MFNTLIIVTKKIVRTKKYTEKFSSLFKETFLSNSVVADDENYGIDEINFELFSYTLI